MNASGTDLDLVYTRTYVSIIYVAQGCAPVIPGCGKGL